MKKKPIAKKDEFKEYLDKSRDFIKNNPIKSVLIGAVIGYAIGSLFHKRERK